MTLALTGPSMILVASTLGLAGLAHCADLLAEASNPSASGPS